VEAGSIKEELDNYRPMSRPADDMWILCEQDRGWLKNCLPACFLNILALLQSHWCTEASLLERRVLAQTIKVRVEEERERKGQKREKEKEGIYLEIYDWSEKVKYI